MRDSNQEKGQRKDEKVDIDWVKKKNKRTKVKIEVEEKETRGNMIVAKWFVMKHG